MIYFVFLFTNKIDSTNITNLNIPEYLKESDLYLSFEGEEFTVNVNVVPPENEIVSNIDEYIALFKVYDFWGKQPSESYLNFEENNRVDVIYHLCNYISSHTNSKMTIEKLLEPRVDIEFHFNSNIPDEFTDIYFTIKYSNKTKTNFAYYVDDVFHFEQNLENLILSIKNHTVYQIGEIRKFFRIVTNENSLGIVTETLLVQIGYTEYNIKSLINCFESILNTFKSNQTYFKRNIEEISLTNLDFLRVLFQDYYADAFIECVNNKDINRFNYIVRYEISDE